MADDVCILNRDSAEYKDDSDCEELNSDSSNMPTDVTVKSNEYFSSSDTIVAEITTSTPLNKNTDYKACYEECKHQLAIQT